MSKKKMRREDAFGVAYLLNEAKRRAYTSEQIFAGNLWHYDGLREDIWEVIPQEYKDEFEKIVSDYKDGLSKLFDKVLDENI